MHIVKMNFLAKRSCATEQWEFHYHLGQSPFEPYINATADEATNAGLAEQTRLGQRPMLDRRELRDGNVKVWDATGRRKIVVNFFAATEPMELVDEDQSELEEVSCTGWEVRRLDGLGSD